LENTTPILDSDFTTTDFDPRRFIASAEKRFGNYLLDLVFYYVLMVLVGVIITLMDPSFPDDDAMFRLLGVLFYFLYCFSFEVIAGKTPAKFITRTRVVDKFGRQPQAISISGRSISRLVPLEPLSFLGAYARGWHDSWSNTWVIDEKKLKVGLVEPS